MNVPSQKAAVVEAGFNGQPARRPLYIMVGGFLGAGKTTAVSKLAKWLVDRGSRVGLITNDQGSGLVDTAFLRSRGFRTEEITGGCFCCRFDSLMDAAKKLTASSRPDVFIAEPVGSCTDLMATVNYPLRRIYGDDFEISPLSVFLDPVRALRVFGLEAGGSFSEKVVYIYRKQVEEADIVVINKVDLIGEERLALLRRTLGEWFPSKPVLEVSAREGQGMEAWCEAVVTGRLGGGRAMEVNYEVYAEGEALLGWLNSSLILKSGEPFDANGLVRALGEDLRSRLADVGAEVAHLKMTFSPEAGLGGMAVLNLVRNDFVPELSQELEDLVCGGELVVNMRAEGAPEVLEQALAVGVADLVKRHPGLEIKTQHREAFRPGKPSPTHRFEESVGAGQTPLKWPDRH